MGKGGGGCQTVGYGYALRMLYALCEKADACTGFKFNGYLKWEGNISESGSYFEAETGQKGKPYSSTFGKSKIYMYFGDNTALPSPPSDHGICYKNLCLADFGGQNGVAFVGDNTTVVPQYQFKLHRYNLFPNYQYQQVSNGANPAYIILEILTKYLDISFSRINLDSFHYAAQILYSENLGLSFLMTREKDAVEWIKDVLRHIDGVLYFDNLDGKYYLKLFRNDYTLSDLPVVDDTNSDSIQIEKSTWDNVVSTFIFKYTDADKGKVNTITITNTAAKIILGYDRSKVYNFVAISSKEALVSVIDRTIKKNGQPLASIKCRINFLNTPNLRPGDPFIVKSERLGIPPTVFRVLKMGGDNEDKTYLDIEGIEDIFGKEINIGITVQDTDDSNINFQLNYPPAHSKIIEAPAEFGRNYNILYFASISTTDDLISGTFAVDNNTNAKRTAGIFYYGQLTHDIDITTTDEDIYNFTITISDPFNNIPSFQLSDEDFQKLLLLVNINNEFFAVKQIIENNDGTKTLYGVIRNLFGEKQSHSINDDVYIYFRGTTSQYPLLPLQTNTANVDIGLYNAIEESPTVNHTLTLTGKAFIPYPPCNPSVYTKSDGKYIKFYPRYPQHGAYYIAESSITSSTDESYYNGEFVINFVNTSKIVTIQASDYQQNGFIEINIDSFEQNYSGEIQISHKVDGQLSDPLIVSV